MVQMAFRDETNTQTFFVLAAFAGVSNSSTFVVPARTYSVTTSVLAQDPMSPNPDAEVHTASITIVPEPTCAAFILTGGLAMVMRRPRRTC
jgi:hypothetical protein